MLSSVYFEYFLFRICVKRSSLILGTGLHVIDPGVLAEAVARALGFSVIGLTGAGGGDLAGVCAVCIRVP